MTTTVIVLICVAVYVASVFLSFKTFNWLSEDTIELRKAWICFIPVVNTIHTVFLFLHIILVIFIAWIYYLQNK